MIREPGDLHLNDLEYSLLIGVLPTRDLDVELVYICVNINSDQGYGPYTPIVGEVCVFRTNEHPEHSSHYVGDKL